MSQIETISKKRIALLLFLIFFIITGLILRMIYLQFFMAGWLKKAAEGQRFRALPLLPHRGTIYDRVGNELAISIDGDSVYAIPAEVRYEKKKDARGRVWAKVDGTQNGLDEKKAIAATVADILGMDQQEVERLLSKRASFVWLKRKASFEEIDKSRRAVNTEGISGIEFTQKARRFYPQSFLASQVLGIAGIDNQGLEGIEKQYDSYLQGIPGSDQAEFDTAGRHIPQGERRYLEPVDGDSLYLTIDENIQYIVERELEKAVTDSKSKRGMALVVDPKTGEILALACRPKFDPNRFGDYPASYRRNPIFTDMYEPGSTFKIFTTIAALEEGKVSLDSTFFDPGYIIVDGQPLKCWKPGGHGSETFVEALENSCNPVFASLALRVTKETFYKYIKAFGFGRMTGIDFPGETPGYLKPLTKVKNVELANIGFGQGISVTPIQMVMGVAAIANGGYLLKPQLVKKIIGPDGKVKMESGRRVVSQAISAKTATQMSKLLQSVVTNGSGNQAYLEGYRVAGKTGTAQKVVPGARGYSQNIASFVGFAPADNPRILGMVILDEPGGPVTYGGVIAAPVLGNIFRDTLRYLNVQPRFEPEQLEKLSSDEILVPNILNMPIAEAEQLLRSRQIDYRLMGRGSYVFDQVPKPGARIKKDSKILIYFDPEEHYNYNNSGKVVLPNFQGYTLRKVDQILTEMGLVLEARGMGVAVAQNPAPGTAVEYGSTVRIDFKPVKDNLP